MIIKEFLRQKYVYQPMVKTMMMALIMILLFLSPNNVHAQNIVRDTEIENFLQELSQPVLNVGGYGQGKLRFIIINDRALNAFVAGGDAIFVNTGLILAARSHEEITSVVAHELGHIVAGHVSQTLKSQENAGKVALATALASLVIGLGTNNIDAAIVGSLGGADTAQKTYLKGSRLREIAADQIAVDLLNQAELPLYPMANFMGYLTEREQGVSFDEYSLTHPLSKDRLNFVQHQNELSIHKDKPERSGFTLWHQRLKAKIIAYGERPSDLIKRYDGNSDIDIYVRAIAFHLNRQPQKAIASLDMLINKNKQDPYLWELKGDILLAANMYDGAVKAYRQAIKIFKKTPDRKTALLDYQIALSLSEKTFAKVGADKPLSDDDKKIFKQAQIYAHRAKNKDAYILNAWQLLSKIYDRLGDEGNRDLSLAEYYFRLGKWDAADRLAQKSLEHFTEGTSGLTLAEDILLQIDNILLEQQKKQ